ncbi:hypothetical protein AA0535_1956 [Asaia krungthepensis NRIC 0535]|uniref:Uncharacterized protein n=1 Tax=Asaia krungthepensis NRIC 0535 TaxID=1307925 RepID=A0ABQ0Q3U3_9PROT|nr:hypothetical protein AA0535_1956 [Asaia krungthepensis NRIC 0535]
MDSTYPERHEGNEGCKREDQQEERETRGRGPHDAKETGYIRRIRVRRMRRLVKGIEKGGDETDQEIRYCTNKIDQDAYQECPPKFCTG